MGYTLRVGMHKRRISCATAVESLNYLGIAFAIVGVIAALRLFNASTLSELSTAQHGRTISNRVSLDNDFHLRVGHNTFRVLQVSSALHPHTPEQTLLCTTCTSVHSTTASVAAASIHS